MSDRSTVGVTHLVVNGVEQPEPRGDDCANSLIADLQDVRNLLGDTGIGGQNTIRFTEADGTFVVVTVSSFSIRVGEGLE